TYRLVQAVAGKNPDFKIPKILAKQHESGKPFVFNFVELAIKGPVAHITVNRPEAMNALNETVITQLGRRFATAEKNDAVKAIVFEGAGKAFVAGADIRYFIDNIKAKKISDIYNFTQKGHELLLNIENSKKLTIALLDGLSLGGGSELALACQVIVGTPDASMAFPETGIGIFPGLGGMLRMARHIGTALAKYYVFTGATIRAKDAQELGIITALVEPSEIQATISKLIVKGKTDKYAARTIPARFEQLSRMCSNDNVPPLLAGKIPAGIDPQLAAKTTRQLAVKAPVALRIANEIIDQQEGKSIPEAVEIELGRLHEIFSTADALAGLSSGGRPPKYKGE
ncbi:MAG: enoyl-CoA hydratase/isomerase family protein, partial [Desulfobacterales bacterium]|nr:enoyl-CoA hydratase/isomerase family protein [Desulfobacterales bacterium]